MGFGRLADDCKNLLYDLRVQYCPAVERNCNPELAFSVYSMATLRAKEFEGGEEQRPLGLGGSPPR